MTKQQYKAYMVVQTARKSGKLLQRPCCICGRKKSHAHHEDYSQPLNVVWLCVEHHGMVHSDAPTLPVISYETAEARIARLREQYEHLPRA